MDETYYTSGKGFAVSCGAPIGTWQWVSGDSLRISYTGYTEIRVFTEIADHKMIYKNGYGNINFEDTP